MTRRLASILAAGALAAVLAAAALRPGVISEQSYRESVRFLASDPLKGRLTGTPENKKAARWLAARFRQLGLKPVPGQRDFFQRFEVTVSATLGKGNRLA